GNQNRCGLLEVLQILLTVIGRKLGVEATKRIQHGGENRHGVGVVREALEEIAHALPYRGVIAAVFFEFGELALGGQFTVNDQVGCFEERGVLGELFNRVAAITQDAL